MKWFIIIIILIIICCLSLILLNNNVEYFSNVDNMDQLNILNYANTSDQYSSPFILHNLIGKEHIEQIISHATNNLIDSEVVSGKYTEVRNSKQTWINKNNPLAKPIFEYLSKLFNIPFENAEDLQIVRYQPNQYYKDHHDSCCDNVKECHNFVKRGGQRKLTVLIYLNDNFEGGETHFKNLNLKLKAKPGDAIVFYPLANDSSYCHPYALHAGTPVTKGEKWVANVWFRENKFQ